MIQDRQIKRNRVDLQAKIFDRMAHTGTQSASACIHASTEIALKQHYFCTVKIALHRNFPRITFNFASQNFDFCIANCDAIPDKFIPAEITPSPSVCASRYSVSHGVIFHQFVGQCSICDVTWLSDVSAPGPATLSRPFTVLLCRYRTCD